MFSGGSKGNFGKKSVNKVTTLQKDSVLMALL